MRAPTMGARSFSGLPEDRRVSGNPEPALPAGFFIGGFMEALPAEFLDVKDLAKRLGLSESALHKHRCKGSGPPYAKIGGRVVYSWPDVMAWIEQRKASSVEQHRKLAVQYRPALSTRQSDAMPARKRPS